MPLYMTMNSDTAFIIDTATDRQNSGPMLYLRTQNDTVNGDTIGMFGIGDSSDTTIKGNLFRVTQTGNVGIGTVSPGNKLDVNGSSITARASSSGGTAAMYVYDEGSSNALGFYKRGSANVGNLNSGVNAAEIFNIGGNMVIYSYTSGTNLTFGTSNVERMRIAGNGNIGMGVTVPTESLDVSGKVKASGGLGAVYSNTYSTTGWSSGSWYTVVPSNTFGTTGAYALYLHWDHGTCGSPYVVIESGVVPVTYSVTGSSASTYTMNYDTHIHSSAAFAVRGVSGSYQHTGIEVQPNFSPCSGSTLYVKMSPLLTD